MRQTSQLYEKALQTEGKEFGSMALEGSLLWHPLSLVML
jgi:hypothetical protein